MNSDLDRLLTIADVAELASVPVRTVETWVYTGRNGPRSMKVGRHRRFRQSDVLKWLDELARAEDNRVFR